MKLAKFSNLHIYFFYLFLLSIPFQTRKVFLTEHSFYSNAFTEYTTFFIYASDILLILALFFWFVFSNKLILMKHVILSLLKGAMVRQAHHDKLKFLNDKLYKHFNIGNLKSARKLPVIWLLLLAFIIWLIISAIVNNNYTEISAFYILKIIEFSLLIIYIYFNLRNKKRLITALFTISLAGFFQGLIAIYQFAYQCPLFKHPFLHKLTGESTVYPHLPGIAKMVVDNEKFIRAYGTFPHPNLLGGFLILSISISIYLLLKHKSYILSRLGFKYNNINTNKSQVRTSLLSLFWIILIFTQTTALLFTFSRTAWIGFSISLFLIAIFYIYHFSSVSRETIEKSPKNATSVIPAEAGIQDLRQKTNYKNRILLISQIFFKRFLISLRLVRNNKKHCFVIQEKALKSKLNNKTVSRETIKAIYFTFVKIIRKILLIETFWIPAYAGMTKKVLNRLRNRSRNNKIVSRETISENLNDKKSVLLINNTDSSVFTREQNCYYRLFCRFKELVVIVLLTLILIIIYFPHINSRINEELSINSSLSSSYLPSNYAFDDRIFYNNVSRETISENSTFGSGPGTFIFQINSYLDKDSTYQKPEPWQYQPAHNVYLLIISEIGIVGFIILALFIIKIMICNYKIIKKPLNKRFPLDNNSNNFPIVSRETISVNLGRELNYYLLSILISFLFIGLFDHFFWTLQQGRLTFWLVLGLMLASSNVISREDKY